MAWYISRSVDGQVLGNRMATIHDELTGWRDALHLDDCLAERLTHAATGQPIENIGLRLAQPDSSTR